MSVEELLWAGADAQAQALRSGQVRVEDLLLAVLARQAETATTLNAFRSVHADSAWAAAEDAQRRIDAGEVGPLLGVPIAIKDEIDVAGDVTGMGGRPQYPAAAEDCEVVARLRAAGAIIVGKTNVPERCLWPFTETLTYGVTRNPWSAEHTPGGSSGGSGAAIAAGVVGVATGSDGGGSIRIPAALCGIFGMKTTRDLVSAAPKGEGWHGLSVIGPLGRTVADVAAMLDVIAQDGGDRGAGPTYRQTAGEDPGPLRIALSWRTPLGPVRIERQRRRAVEETAERLRGLGHEVVEREVPCGPYELAQFLVRYLRGFSDDVAQLPHPEWLEARTRSGARIGRLVPDRLLAWARQAESVTHERVDALFQEVDVVLQPAIVGPPWRIGAYQRRGALATIAGVSQRLPHLALWNVLGNPVASVPAGRDSQGLPMGVQLVGPHRAERRLLALAGQLERDRPWATDIPAPLER